MKIDTLSQLESLIKLCRKHGVENATIDGITIKLGQQPTRAKKPKSEEKDSNEQVETYTYTDEDYKLWSAIPQG